MTPMRTETIFVIWNCIRIKSGVSREYNWFSPHSSFSTDLSEAIPLLQFYFVGASTVSYVMVVLSLLATHLSFFWASGGLCYLIVAFSEQLHLIFSKDLRLVSIVKRQPSASERGGTTRKQACSNILKISPPKTKSFQIKILIFFIFMLKT